MKLPHYMRLAALFLATLLSLCAQADPQLAGHRLQLKRTRYQLRAGGRISLDAPLETAAFVRSAQNRAVRVVGGPTDARFSIGFSKASGSLLLAASLQAKPGTYSIVLSAQDETGAEQSALAEVVVDSAATVPSGSTIPPVVLLNGWQGQSCPPSDGPSQTFGSLADQLQSVNGVPVVYFFDNCVEDPNAKIEDLGQDLGHFLSQIVYDDGTPVPQVDIVAYSMGGLITRAYLAGIHSDGTFAPALKSGIRKFVQVAAPNFGSHFIASVQALTGKNAQAVEMLPGSLFLWNLATWNQRGDDLRNVDALAIVGSGGTMGTRLNSSDGFVSLDSASLAFASQPERTRILPYCHSDSTGLSDSHLGPDCIGAGIANVDAAPETGSIILSFLGGTSDWTAIGATPSQDQNLSRYGGFYFSLTGPDGKVVNDVTSVSWGPVALNPGGASTSVYYQDFVAGTAAFQAVSAGFGAITCSTVTAQIGDVNAIRCKGGASILSLSPKVRGPLGIVVPSGSPVTINGTGFGASRCNTCGVTLYPSGVSLPSVSWSDTAITVNLPASTSGFAQFAIQTPSGSDSMNFIAAPPAQ